MIALVTGASGFIGRSLVHRLLEEGYTVRVLTRNPHRAFSDRVDVRVGNLASGEGVTTELASGVETIFHCAGEVNNRADMRRLHVDGTRRLLDSALHAATVRGSPVHWVQLSSVGAYGRQTRGSDRVVAETSPENPTGEYEVTKTESDGLVSQAAASGGLTFAIVRPTNVIGRTMTNDSLRSLLRLIRRGWFLQVGRGGAIANYIHVDDVVAATLECSRHPAARGETFIISSDCLWRDLVDHVALIYGVRRHRFTVPESVAITVAALAQRWPGSLLTVARVDALIGRTRYSSEKIRTALTFRLSKPMPGGVDDLLQDLR